MKGKLLGILWILMFLMATVVSGTGVELTSSSPAEIHVYPGQSIQEAINAAAPGDTIIIHEGTYNEKLVVDKSLTIEGVDKEQVILNGTGLSEKGISVEADYVTIRNLTVCCFVEGNWPWGVELVGASHCIVEDLIVYNCTSGGINLYRGCHNNTVRNNLIKYCDGNGISIYGSDEGCWHNLIENNEIIDCAFAETGGGTYRVPAICIFSNASYNTVTGNIIRQEAYVGRGRGITLWGSTYGGSDMAETGNIIENNFVENFDIGIYIIGVNLYTGTKNLVTYTTVRYNNLTKNNVGFKQIGFEGDYSPITLRYNNIYDNHDYGALVDATYGTAILDARFNWWGDASGPSGMGPGAGDAISENVTYSPWLGYPYGTIPMTYHVDPTGKIQDAINAASPGDTIKVHEGTYTEQLIINKSLTLIGDPKPKIVAPDTRATFTVPESGDVWDPIIFAYGSLTGTETISVTIEGFEIDGGNKAASGSTFVAMLYRNVKPGVISDSIICNMYPPSGKGSGPETVGIAVYGDSNVEIRYNEIMNFSRVGIFIAGDAGPSVDPIVTIQENVVFGNGLENETNWWAENGIQVGYGASGYIAGNQVFNCTVNNPYWASSGIIIVDTDGVIVNSNYVTGCDVGIAITDFPAQYGSPWNYSILSNVDIIGNTLIGNTWQIDISNDARNITVTYNNITNAVENGIDVWSYFGDVYPTNVKIHYNNIEGSGSYGIWASEELAAQPVDARYNWWGDETGPYHPTLNPEGKGDNVSDYVNFDHWLLEEYPPPLPSPVLYVAPSEVEYWTIAYGENFTVEVKIDEVTDLAGYEFKLYWDTNLLDLVDVEITPPWPEGNYMIVKNYTDESSGLYWLGVGSYMIEPFSGSTTLAILTFKITFDPVYPENATCLLDLADTKLSAPAGEPIYHTTYDGKYTIYSTRPKIEVKPATYTAHAYEETFTIDIYVSNIVNLYNYTFKLSYNTTLLDAVNLEIGPFLNPPIYAYKFIIDDANGEIWLWVWSTSGTPTSGSGVLATITFKVTKATTWTKYHPNILECVFDLHDTMLITDTGIEVSHDVEDGLYQYVPKPGDLDRDGHVGLTDLRMVAYYYDPAYSPIADLNEDGVVDIYDLEIVAYYYGEDC